MRTHEGQWGQAIKQAFSDCIREAIESDEPVTLTWNGELYEVQRSDSVESLMREHRLRAMKQQIDYHTVGNAKVHEAERRAQRDRTVAAVDAVMDEFLTFNLGDQEKLITFFWNLADASDGWEVESHYRRQITDWLEYVGYVAAANTGESFDPDDRDIYARYVIGQALDWIKTVGAMHDFYYKIASGWRERFAPTPV